jgi:site-specific DNA-methyltransferase (adenine-specific)
MKELRLLNGDCLDKLKELDNNSIDSIVTDPPYGLSFMGKKWDYDVPSVEIWQECLRVLKPGGHLLAFAGSRTYHRMAVRIEDAGFDIRDQIMWIYGSGFPKSHNVGKSIDKMQGNQRQVVAEEKGTYKLDNAIKNAAVYGKQNQKMTDDGYEIKTITKGNSVGEGWGTALKPAHEPIVMARKPIEGTVAENTLQYGVGGLNIDATRVQMQDGDKMDIRRYNAYHDTFNSYEDGESAKGKEYIVAEPHEGGRWPANVIMDEHAGQILDKQSGNKKSSKRGSKYNKPTEHTNTYTPAASDYRDDNTYGDEGGASRFFYCPKANAKDRDSGIETDAKALRATKGGTRDFNARCASCGKKFIGSPETICSCDNPITDNQVFKRKNNHPTVKPTDLMKYLIRLVTPKDGIVLDPFMGSGSTGKAAMQEGMWFVGIEREKEYYEIAKQRIEYEMDKRKFW